MHHRWPETAGCSLAAVRRALVRIARGGGGGGGGGQDGGDAAATVSSPPAPPASGPPFTYGGTGNDSECPGAET